MDGNWYRDFYRDTLWARHLLYSNEVSVEELMTVYVVLVTSTDIPGGCHDWEIYGIYTSPSIAEMVAKSQYDPAWSKVKIERYVVDV